MMFCYLGSFLLLHDPQWLVTQNFAKSLRERYVYLHPSCANGEQIIARWAKFFHLRCLMFGYRESNLEVMIMIQVSLSTLIIVALIFLIVGLVLGVSLSRPNYR